MVHGKSNSQIWQSGTHFFKLISLVSSFYGSLAGAVRVCFYRVFSILPMAIIYAYILDSIMYHVIGCYSCRLFVVVRVGFCH